MTAVRSVRVACIAGTRPKSTALPTATIRLNTSARRSSWNASAMGDPTVSRSAEERHASVADGETQDSARERDQQAFSHQLADQSAASGADRETQRHLARAGRCAAGQQPRDVRACDQ